MEVDLVPTQFMVIDVSTGYVIGFVQDYLGQYCDVEFRGWVLDKKGKRIKVGDYESKHDAAREVAARYIGLTTLKP